MRAASSDLISCRLEMRPRASNANDSPDNVTGEEEPFIGEVSGPEARVHACTRCSSLHANELRVSSSIIGALPLALFKN